MQKYRAVNGILALIIGMTHDIMTFVTTQVTIDSAGRVVLPKPLRKELDIGPGDLLELERVGERITLRPVRGGAPLAKEKGVWVFRTGQPLAASVTDDLLEEIREQRDKQNLAAQE
jgi:AbrB family looped-hinge helix DNA binding protein